MIFVKIVKKSIKFVSDWEAPGTNDMELFIGMDALA
jgi:hypothetical protein